MKYEDMSSESLKGCIEYLSIILLISFLLAMLIAIPRLATIPSAVEDGLDSFSKLKISINQTMEKAVMLPKNRPFLILDLTEENQDKVKAPIMINKSEVNYKVLFFRKSFKTEELGEPLAHKSKIKSFLVIIILMLLPLALVGIFLFNLMKFIILLLIISTIAYILLKMMKNKFAFGKCFKMAIFASTMMVIIETLNIGWQFNLYYIPKILFLVLYIISLGFSHEGW